MSRFHRPFLTTRQQRELPALLSYAFLWDECTVLHKDGALSAHFQYVAYDSASATDERIDEATETLANALQGLGDGWMVETQVINTLAQRPENPVTWPDPVTTLLADARQIYQDTGTGLYNSTAYLSVTYTPTRRLGKRLAHWWTHTTAPLNRIEHDYDVFTQTLHRFVQLFQALLPGCMGAGIGPSGTVTTHRPHWTPLRGSALVTFLHQCLTGVTTPLAIPNTGCFLDAYVASTDFISGLTPQIGPQHIGALAIEDVPDCTYPALLAVMDTIPCAFRWSTRFIPLSTETASRHLNAIKSRWSNQAIGLIGTLKTALGIPPTLNAAAEYQKHATENALTDNRTGALGYGFLTSTLIVMDNDKARLNESLAQISDAIASQHCKVRHESINATEAFLGSLPGHGGYNLRKPLVDTRHAAHLFPTTAIWQGEPYAPSPFYGKKAPPLLVARTEGARPFYANLHVSDVGHFMVLGPTGAGKSTLVATLACHFRQYPNNQVIVFDKDHSHRCWLTAIGGHYTDIHAHTALAPFARLAQCEVGSAAYLAELSVIVDWLVDIGTLQHVTVTATHKNQLRHAVEALVQQKAAPARLDCLVVPDATLQAALDAFNTGAVGALMQGTDVFQDTQSVRGFDMTQLLSLSPAAYIPVLRCLFHQLQTGFAQRRPTLLIIEEAWTFLQHPVFAAHIHDWLLTLRKFNVAVGLVTQQITHITQSTFGDTLCAACPTKIYLPNPAMSETPVADSYHKLGLNTQQQAVLAHAIPKYHYYWTSPLGHRLISLDLDPVTLAFMSINRQEDIDAFDACFNREDPRWLLQWLTHNGLTQWRDYAEQRYPELSNHGA